MHGDGLEDVKRTPRTLLRCTKEFEVSYDTSENTLLNARGRARTVERTKRPDLESGGFDHSPTRAKCQKATFDC